MKTKKKQILRQIAFVIIVTFLAFPPAQAQNDENIVDRVSKAVGVSLPDGYDVKIKELVGNSITKYKDASSFTENFIVKNMRNNWNIDKQNQLLFIWDAICDMWKNKNIYDGEDGNEKRLNEFEEALDSIDICNVRCFYEYSIIGLEELSVSISNYNKNIDEWNLGQEAIDRLTAFRQEKEALEKRAKSIESKLNSYSSLSILEQKEVSNNTKQLLTDILKQQSAEYDRRIAEAKQRSAEYDRRSAEAKQRSAEYDRRSAEAKQRSAEYDRRSAEALTSSLKNLVWFFNRYHMKDKEAIPPNETQEWKNKGKEVFTRCKDINLNYKAILSKELGDDKKVQEMLKFYDIE